MDISTYFVSSMVADNPSSISKELDEMDIILSRVASGAPPEFNFYGAFAPKVTFSPDAKKHDGVESRVEMIKIPMELCFRLKRIPTMDEVSAALMRKFSKDELITGIPMICNYYRERIEALKKTRILGKVTTLPLLPSGASHIKIPITFISSLQTLISYLEAIPL